MRLIMKHKSYTFGQSSKYLTSQEARMTFFMEGREYLLTCSIEKKTGYIHGKKIQHLTWRLGTKTRYM